MAKAKEAAVAEVDEVEEGAVEASTLVLTLKSNGRSCLLRTKSMCMMGGKSQLRRHKHHK
jgi:hypothetical protein